MRISTDRGMVRLDLCVDYNRGRVSVYSTEKWGGGVRVYGPEGTQRVGGGWVGPNLWTRRGAERLG